MTAEHRSIIPQRVNPEEAFAARGDVLSALYSLGGDFPEMDMFIAGKDGDLQVTRKPGFTVVGKRRAYRPFGVLIVPYVVTVNGIFEPEVHLESTLGGIHYLPVADSLTPEHEIPFERYAEVRDEVVCKVQRIQEDAARSAQL